MRNTAYEDYDKAVRIDKHALDDELVRQPSLYHDVSEEYALAVSRRDKAKDDMKETESRLYVRLRIKAEENGEKITEKQLEHMVMTSKERKEAMQAYLDACLESDKWQGLKESFMQRSYVLKDLAGLYIAGYFGTASVRGEVSREAQEKRNDERRTAIQRVRMGK